MGQARQRKHVEDQQCRLAEKYERLSDYSPRSDLLDNHIDAMSADSFPASDPPSFPSVRRKRRPKDM